MAVAIQAGSVVTFSGPLAVLGTPSYRDLAVVVGAGANRCVFLMISGSADILTNSWVVPTFNGIPMTLAGNGPSNGANSNSAVYYAPAPSPGTFNVRVSTSVHYGFQATMTAFAATGVHQSTPTGPARNISNASASTPVTDTIAVAAGGMALHAFSVFNSGATVSPVLQAGQTALTQVIRGNFDEGHDYKADATSMGFTMTAGARQTSQLIVPVVPAVTPPDAAVNVTTDGAVFAGSPGPGNSSQAALAVATDAAAFAGTAGTVPANLVTDPFKNNTGTLLPNLSGLTVAVLRMSDFALALVLTGRATNGAAVLSINSGSITAGVTYLVVTRDAAGTAVGAEVATASP